MEATNVIAPFIMKTYQMVNDPSTDNLITWGRSHNSFIVIEPLDFSQRLLPAYFKHNNFSSFVRQLNTYGFRKVDPDRWEFANEWFLKGQKHLLNNIVRRKQSNRSSYFQAIKNEDLDLDDEDMVTEIVRLKEEQKSLDEELQSMNKRLDTTERRPQQMMALLSKVVEDPDILPRIMTENKHRVEQINEKKRRLVISSTANTNSSVKSEEDDGTLGVLSSPEMDSFSKSSPSPDFQKTNPPAIWSQPQVFGRPESYVWTAIPSRPPEESSAGGVEKIMSNSMPAVDVSGFVKSSGSGGYFTVMSESSPPPPYPFSLLEGGF